MEYAMPEGLGAGREGKVVHLDLERRRVRIEIDEALWRRFVAAAQRLPEAPQAESAPSDPGIAKKSGSAG
jgi:hypothetical protein